MMLSKSNGFLHNSPPPRSSTGPNWQSAPIQAPLDGFEAREKDEFSVGMALLAGLSLLGLAGSTTPPPVPQIELATTHALPSCLTEELQVARVIVVDDFWNAEQHTTHGEIVEAELTRLHKTSGPEANLSLVRQQVSLWGGHHGIEQGRPGALENHLRDHFAGRMNRDTEALQRIADQGGERAVIHQSQGASQSRVVDELYYRALRDDDYRARLQEQLDLKIEPLSSNADKAKFLGRLVAEADAIYSSDPAVLAAREQLREVQNSLHSQGFIHVISAGNQGYLGRDMQRLQVDIPEHFFVNDFAGPHSIIVGASDNQSKGLDSGNHTVASIASPGTGAHIAADGVDRPLLVDGKSGHHTGSSYAAPQVSSTILQMMRGNPELSREEALQLLQEAADPVTGAEDFLGAGVLRTPTTLLCLR